MAKKNINKKTAKTNLETVKIDNSYELAAILDFTSPKEEVKEIVETKKLSLWQRLKNWLKKH